MLLFQSAPFIRVSRIYCEDKQTFLQDSEDDGETAAGGRLLHLMEVSVELHSEVHALIELNKPDSTWEEVSIWVV